MASSQRVTRMPRAWSRGDETAREPLAVFSSELRQRARRHLGRERRGETRKTTEDAGTASF